MASVFPGTEEHKKLYCGEFTRSFDPFEVAKIKWPTLTDPELARLRALPFWEEAVKTERKAGMRVRLMADEMHDPMIREAIAMQAYEETRHADLLSKLLGNYGIPVPDFDPVPDRTARWGFLRMGYGEVFDSVFAFGLFKIAGDPGFFSPQLIEIFEKVMQEEARHIIFFTNWTAYEGRNLQFSAKSWFVLQRALGVSIQALGRLRTAIEVKRGAAPSDDFTMQVPDSIKTEDLTLRKFLEIALSENDRRLSRYDSRLLRPHIVPHLIRTALRFVPADAPANGSRP